MLAARKVEIIESEDESKVITRCRHPLISGPLFGLAFAFWMLLLIIFGGGALGYVSPDTASWPIRVFIGIFAVLWVVLGIMGGPALFGKAFATREFRATKPCFRVVLKSFVGSSDREYPWPDIELFTEVVTGGNFDRDIAMIVNGRHIALDYSLSARDASRAVEVLSRSLERYHAR